MAANAGVGPRAPKDEFMKALGLDPSQASHEGVYRAMREEAITIYAELNKDRASLIEEKRNDPSVRPPFFWHHISRDRQNWAVLRTWQNAPVGSVQKQMFDRGATNGEHAPNWVTLWLLYSVFRSRDIRNNRNRRNGDGGSIGGSGGGSGNTETQVYDQVRDVHRRR